MEGFEVMGVEIEAKIAELYKHPVILEDVRNLKGTQFPGYDLIIGSPPCRDFSQLPDKSTTKKGVHREWNKLKNPEEGLKNVNAFLRIRDEAKPKFWLMENVHGLNIYVGPPKLVTNLAYSEKGYLAMKRCFWGNFPPFLIPRGRIQGKERITSKLRKWERAKIPLPIARALGKAVRQEIEK